jgi:C4-dicarboxylate-specific signal transduction histidine kinase
VVEQSFTLLNSQLRSRGIDIQLNIAEDLPPVHGNANQLEQVLINLLSNARDALAQIENPTISIDLRHIDQNIFLALSDNGPGIASDIRGKIFDPFFTTKGIGEGTGLGLSISHGIVNDHGGTIWVDDAKGGGAAFTIKLPCAVMV